MKVSRRDMLLTGAATAAIAPLSSNVLAQAGPGASPSGATWDLSELYPTPAAWETERQAILRAIPTLTAHRGKLGESAATLKAAFQAQSDLYRRTSRLYTYASLAADENLKVAVNQERKQQAQDVFTALGEATAWTNP